VVVFVVVVFVVGGGSGGGCCDDYKKPSHYHLSIDGIQFYIFPFHCKPEKVHIVSVTH